jgi:deoxyribonuclease-4
MTHTNTLIVGPHTSIAKGYLAALKDACAIGASTFQFFTRNPRGGAARALDPEEIAAFSKGLADHHFGPLLAHALYTMNMASKTEKTRAFAAETFADDLKRMAHLPCALYNFHPGSHTGQGAAVGIDEIVDILNGAMTHEQTTTVLLETMSGKGTEIGRSFEELAEIIVRVEVPEHMGVCLDTCHVYSAGYDIVHDLDGVLKHFDDVVGLDRLKAVHLNDSKTEFGSHKDRHEKLGAGSIGWDAVGRIVTHPALKDLPFFLETPQSNYTGYRSEIERLRQFAAES